MSWFSQQWNRFAGASQGDPNAPIQYLDVSWGRERFSIPVKEERRGQKTLRDFKNLIVQHTSVPYEQVKLIYHGLILKDDKQPLVAYGLHTGARLGLVGTQGGVPIVGDRPGGKASVFDGQDGGSAKRKAGRMTQGEELARRKKERENDTSEAGLLSRIDEAVNGVRKDVVPEVDEFERQVGQQAQSEAVNSAEHTSSPAFETTAKQHRKLSELLLRALLTLDGVAVSSETTRTRRKEAVKEVQSHLDRVDAAWQAYKARKASV